MLDISESIRIGKFRTSLLSHAPRLHRLRQSRCLILPDGASALGNKASYVYIMGRRISCLHPLFLLLDHPLLRRCASGCLLPSVGKV